jgi:hypothetical protein
VLTPEQTEGPYYVPNERFVATSRRGGRAPLCSSTRSS